MKNVIIGTALNDHVRIYLADTKEVVDEARKLHGMYPTSLAALGRVMSVTAIMGLKQKEQGETVISTINGGGPIGTVMAIANSSGEVKGFVGDNEIYLKYNENNKLAVGLAVGNDGYLQVIKNLNLKQNYVSQVKLQTGEIGDDFAYYFSVSEQIPSVVSVGVLVDTDYSCKSAGVLLIELLPNHTEEDIQYVETLAAGLRPISTVLLEDNDLHKYFYSLFPDGKVLEEKEIRYVCDCSKERFMRNLLTLPKEDLLEIRQDKNFEIQCQFCSKVYTFTEEDIDTLLEYAEIRERRNQ